MSVPDIIVYWGSCSTPFLIWLLPVLAPRTLPVCSLFLPENQILQFPDIVGRPSQYTRQFKKWGFSRNWKQQQYEFTVRRLKKRKQEGKEDNDVYKNGALFNNKRLKRELSRHVRASVECLPITGQFGCFEAELGHPTLIPAGSDAPTPDGVAVCAPENVDNAAFIELSNLPFSQFQSFLEANCTWIGPVSPSDYMLKILS